MLVNNAVSTPTAGHRDHSRAQREAFLGALIQVLTASQHPAYTRSGARRDTFVAEHPDALAIGHSSPTPCVDSRARA